MENLLIKYLENINPMIVFVSFIILVLIGWIIIKNRKVISEFFNDLYNRNDLFYLLTLPLYACCFSFHFP